jgi:DMSO reductase anchor subunit
MSAEIATSVPTWKKIVAAFLDFMTIFFAGGFAIGAATGQNTPEGFNLTGVSALLLFALIFLYFFAGSKYLGGTIWQRILGTRR